MPLNLYGLTLSDETQTRLTQYRDLLCKWNKAINIVSPTTLPEAWRRHFIDSAQIAHHIPHAPHVYADLGCGGGFPGLVVAMMRPDLDVHLIESDERKCQFMRTVARETHTQNVTIHTQRVEHMHQIIQPDVVSARALASLDMLFTYCLPWAVQNPGLRFIFMKGERADSEMKDARQAYDFDATSHDSITNSMAQIITISGLKRRM